MSHSKVGQQLLGLTLRVNPWLWNWSIIGEIARKSHKSTRLMYFRHHFLLFYCFTSLSKMAVISGLWRSRSYTISYLETRMCRYGRQFLHDEGSAWVHPYSNWGSLVVHNGWVAVQNKTQCHNSGQVVSEPVWKSVKHVNKGAIIY